MNKAVFFDRDGVLINSLIRNNKPEAIQNISNFRYLLKNVELISKLRDLGYFLIIITNQPDVSRGLITNEFVLSINEKITKELKLDHFYVCPHDDNDNCSCRKPKNGLVLRAVKDFNLNIKKCYFIGDRWKDVEAAYISNCRSIFIDYGYHESMPSKQDFTVNNIDEAIQIILNENK